ncbi:hypothetical protein [Bradyrhizobium genosp. SA-3]|uniref:hypothetical protein n=1 Tax=Bradyrhizobium genosp. SA-3 TaxID=508868 RepID=UPI001029DCE4|nr:hypothetical protein [Bradyrhizobium genosp. SA-3]
MNNLSAPGVIENHDVDTLLGLDVSPDYPGRLSMASAFVSASIFGAGLILGYALRAWRVQRRAASSGETSTPTSTFGHARRAF